MRYSLANYICTIKSSDSDLVRFYGGVTIGGQGTETDSLSATRKDDLYNTTSYATGGYVHSKNLSKVGTISITLSQLSKNVGYLKELLNAYTVNDYSGLDISLDTNDGTNILKAIDCMPVKIPQQQFTNSAGTQTWEFTCGEINFN